MSNIKTLNELQQYLSTLPDIPKNYRIAVGALFFTKDDHVILLERGEKARDSKGKLEGIGGGIDEGEHNLHNVLLREVKEEIGDVQIAIDEMLMVKTIYSEHKQWWVVIDYLCRLLSGIPQNMEPEKCTAIRYYYLKDIPLEKLSDFQQPTMKKYKEKYGDNPYYK